MVAFDEFKPTIAHFKEFLAKCGKDFQLVAFFEHFQGPPLGEGKNGGKIFRCPFADVTRREVPTISSYGIPRTGTVARHIASTPVVSSVASAILVRSSMLKP